MKVSSDFALQDAIRASVWSQYFPNDFGFPKVENSLSTDLLVIGGGFTGLWAAILAKEQYPELSVTLVDAETIGHAASSRNGGFISESLTHGHAHGQSLWPKEMPALVELGRENMREIQAFLARHCIDADFVYCGKSSVAVNDVQVKLLKDAYEIQKRFGEDVTLLSASEAQADIASPTYRGGIRLRTGNGLFNPVKLIVGMTKVAQNLGVQIYEKSKITAISEDQRDILLTCNNVIIKSKKVILATNAFTPLLKSVERRVLPLFDHVLATEVLSDSQLASLGWRESQGVTDMGNQFHYYRKTPDNRILWGGYDANYYYGNDSSPAREIRPESHQLLARQFQETFPQLEGVRFEYQWAGLIDSTSRFTPYFKTTMNNKVSFAIGFTGLGTGSSRFGAQIALDLLFNPKSELLKFDMVKKSPIPFPPEPLRYMTVGFTRGQLQREDLNGKRGLWLRILDFFGVGFNS